MIVIVLFVVGQCRSAFRSVGSILQPGSGRSLVGNTVLKLLLAETLPYAKLIED